jgi:hypothetical protein
VRASVCGVLLARRLATLGPEPGITRRVQYRENDHAPRPNAIEDAIGKARYERAPHLAVDLREHVRIALDRIENGVDCRKKALPQPFRLPFVLSKPCCKIPPDLPTVDNRQGHQRRRASASTWSFETTSSGFLS